VLNAEDNRRNIRGVILTVRWSDQR